MKLKKVKKILPPWETIRVWGKDENVPLYHGRVETLPKRLYELELLREPGGGYFDIRYDCVDCEPHVAVFVEENRNEVR